ncbi:hypothetical protein ACJ77P_09700 [Syntrophus buswellii]|jgi:hypothetical protein
MVTKGNKGFLLQGIPALILLTSTIGFPNVAAAISWVDNMLGE